MKCYNDGNLKVGMQLAEAPTNDINVDINGSCKEGNHNLTKQDKVTLDEFACLMGVVDDLTLDNNPVARPVDNDYFPSQETEVVLDSGQLVMDYFATQETEVILPS
jgi:hypothetical protein